MDPITIIFSIAILIMSVVAHEVAHGYAAEYLGDPTARLRGRLTLNPIVHLDMFGSIILPILLTLLNGPVFGWAKPVPYNPYNLRNRRWGEAIVAGAGPLTNIVIAVIFALLARLAITGVIPLGSDFVGISQLVVFINIFLAVFNMMPVPPFDGSKVLFAFLPQHLQKYRLVLEQQSILVLIFVIFFVVQFLGPVVFKISDFLIRGLL
ncbi:MAG: site-2 protease family protein [Candidatus Paceibacterota bacterium]